MGWLGKGRVLGKRKCARHQLSNLPIYDYPRAFHIPEATAKSFFVALSLYILDDMAFKRKRSGSDTSPSSSSTATFPSRDPSSSPCPDISMLDGISCPAQPIHRPEIPPPHLNSRTRKRFRDNRPDESKIHGIDILHWIEDTSAPFSYSFADRRCIRNDISKALLSLTISSSHWTS